MVEWLCIILGLLTLLYFYLTWNNGYWKKRGIPYLKPLPIIGNMLDALLQKQNAHFLFVDIYSKFPNEPVCGFFDFTLPVLLVRSPELMQTILIKDFQSFHDNDFSSNDDVDPYLAINPFLSTGSDWKTNRAAITPAFTVSKMKGIFPQMKEICQQLESHLDSHLNEKIEAKELSFLFSSDIIANCAFGIKGNCFAEEDHVFKRMGRKMAEVFHNPFFTFIISTIPRLSKYLKIRIIPEAVYDFLKDAIMQVNDFRKSNNIVRNDFADFLLSTYNNSKLEEKQRNISLLGHALTFFMEGIETSSISGSFALYELARNPHVQETLRAEILSHFTKREDVDYDTLHKLPYLNKVLSESLRKFGPGVSLKKLCTQTTVLDIEGKPLKVEKGTPVVLPIYGIHHDPKYYPDPEKFDPERFSEENIKSRPPFTFLPFGEGPRQCIGVRFVNTKIKLYLITILLKYKVKCCDSKPIELNKCDLLLSAKNGLWIKFEKLEN